MEKVIVLEVDQFTSTGQVFDPNKLSAYARSRIAKGCRDDLRLLEVNEDSQPPWAHVWYRSDESGKLVLWKSNYDSSG